ncbi:MAG: hypothetical protein AAF541_16660 [Pseudomonadota bacterium]
MKTLTMITATALTMTTLAVEARTSSTSDYRGYQNCIKAAKQTSQGLVPSRQYYLEREDGSAWYYINATRWNDGDRASVRIACETSLRGHKLVSHVVEAGQFSQSSTAQGVEVAAQ